MTEPKTSRDWESVDESAGPESMVDYLDTVTALDGVQAYKLKTYLHLQPSEGQTILDVGCGAGDDVRALARLVGPSGRVIGVDSSNTMIAEARNRPENRELTVEFQQGNALDLTFADDMFDGCRSDRVFQHMPEREKALAEMIRVTKPGGRICVADTDWGTLVVDMPNRALTNRITHHICGRLYNGWSGRQILGLFHGAGLLDLKIEQASAILTDLAVADRILYLTEGAEDLQKTGGITAAEAATWYGYLEDANRRGVFFSSLSGFLVSGRKP